MLALGSDGHRWWGIALGALDVIVGIVIMAWPEIGLVTLAVFFALTMLFRGVFGIVIGLKLRGLRDDRRGPAPSTPRPSPDARAAAARSAISRLEVEEERDREADHADDHQDRPDDLDVDPGQVGGDREVQDRADGDQEQARRRGS